MTLRWLHLLLLFIVYNVAAQRVIQMEYSGGIYKVPCTVNGANMKMVFDTGASTVCISRATAIYLYQNGYLSENDFKGTGYSSTASGDIVNHMVVNLKDIEIGGMHLRNIEGVVMESLTAPLLLGQTAISKLGSVTIKGNQLIIYDNNYSSSYNNYSKGRYFVFNGYKIDSESLIQALQMNYCDFPGFANHSPNRKSCQAKEVNNIIGFIRRGECYFELNSMFFTNGYADIKRSKKELSYVQEAIYYIHQISNGFIQRGEYIR